MRGAIQRRRLEREMQDEMRQHLAQSTQRLMDRGMSPADAALEARREFGNVGVLQEESRDAWGVRWLESLLGDLRFAVRAYARKPLAAATIVVVMALGIGVNSALYSVLQSITSRAAPGVADGETLKRIYGSAQERRGASYELRELSLAEVDALAAHSETFASVAGWDTEDAVIQWKGGTSNIGASIEFVTPGFWTTL